MASFNAKELELLKSFVELCKKNPGYLHTNELTFFRQWLESMGANIPPPPAQEKKTTEEMPTEQEENKDEKEEQKASQPEPAEPESEESEESDLEFDKDECIEPDTDEPQPMGDSSIEVTDEMEEKARNLRAEAQSLMSDGKYEDAVSLFTEAILSNPKSAPLFYKRASCYVKLCKPNAAIRDCDRAMQINPDSAQPYKWRGRAFELLGDWEKSANDLHVAAKLDFDDQVDEWLHKVEPKAKRITEHKRKYEIKKEERELRKKKERMKKAQEAREKAKREEEERQRSQRSGGMPGGFPGGMPGGFPGGMPGGFPGEMPEGFPGGMPGGFPGGMPGGFPGGMPGGSPGGMPGGAPGEMPQGAPNMADLLQDPEIMAAFQDAEVMAAFQDVSQNPENIKKYENNPKIKKIIDKLSAKFGKPGGASGDSQPPPQATPSSGGFGGGVPEMDID